MPSGSDIAEYMELVFERIDDASVLSNFYCGIQEMDDFIPKPSKALETQAFLMEKEFPAVEITYLAVGKDWRGKGIGEFIISQVENKVLRERPECEFVTVEAYHAEGYSAVGFYAHCDFTPAEQPMGFKNTLRMYKVLHPSHR